MVLLLDIGNTHVHCGLADRRRVRRRWDFPTVDLLNAGAAETTAAALRQWVGRAAVTAAALCSVVPAATPPAQALVEKLFGMTARQLTHTQMPGLRLDYPRPETLGQDRLANALAARHHFGAPVVAVGFGTAVIFDVVNSHGDYVGGIIAPGLALMTRYLHEKTAQLPEIRVREPRSLVGRNTEQAMLVGAVVGYRGLVRELITGLKRELRAPQLPVVATGGYAPLLAKHLPEITRVYPGLTLEGLRLWWELTENPGAVAEPVRNARPAGRKRKN